MKIAAGVGPVMALKGRSPVGWSFLLLKEGRLMKLGIWLLASIDVSWLVCMSTVGFCRLPVAVSLIASNRLICTACGLIKVVRWFGRVLALHEVVRIIGEWSVELAAKVKNKRDEKIRSDPGEAIFVIPMLTLSRWLRAKTATCGTRLSGEDGVVAETDVDACSLIFDFWDSFWKDAEENSDPLHDRIAYMLRNLPERVEESWRFPDGEALASRAAKARGSSGPDTWCGAELRALPSPAFDLFARLAERWLQVGAVSSQFCENRMVLLPKPGKINELGICPVSDCFLSRCLVLGGDCGVVVCFLLMIAKVGL